MLAPSVDKGFIRELKNLDRRLGIKFNGDNFVIVYDRGHGEPVNIAIVANEDGTFKQPDRRDLAFICSGDLERMSHYEWFLKSSQYIEAYKNGQAKKRKELIKDLTRDDKIQLMNTFGKMYNASKCNSAFRRIDHKPGKNTVMSA